MITHNTIFITSSILISGAEKIAIETAIWLKNNRNFEIAIVPHVSNFDKEYYQYIQHKIPIIYPFKNNVIDYLVWKVNALSLKLIGWPLREYIYSKWIRKYISKNNISTVVSHSYPADLFAYKCLKGLKLKHIIVEHGSYSRFISNDVDFNDSPLLSANIIVAVSEWSKNLINKYLKNSDAQLIYNAKTPAISTNKNQEKLKMEYVKERTLGNFTFCLIGRGVIEKGWELAIKSVLSLNSQGIGVNLICIGEGQYLESLQKEYEGNNNIIFIGRVFDLKPFLRFADVGLVLSRCSEAFGMTTLDFFEMGLPVIASNLGGIPEVIGNNKNSGGILVEPDNIKEVTDAMKLLISNPKIYKSFVKRASLRSKLFSFEEMAINYYNLIKK